ncbi:hypothetical protein HX858_09440 [Marine Group I thaumarchaeote]|uniref:Uncharacterized protein n=1 Tax=Marine Group I thaumarchaeote TaxID=2511932 RepID=A0A7K4MWY8_9ARCH|nr:hypothetical protein [Marine Group I thaumarchaeote]
MSEIVKTLLKDVGIDFDTSVVITDIHEEKVEKERIATKKRAEQKHRRKKLAEKTKLNQIIFEEKIPPKDIDGSKTSKLLKDVGIDFAPRKSVVEKIEKVEEIDKIPFPEVKCYSGLAKEKPEKEEVKYGYTVKKEILDTSGLDDIIDVFDGNYVVSRPDFSNEDMISPATEKITDQKSKEPLIEISPLRQELDLFKKNIMEQVFQNTSAAVGNLSGAGSGEVRLEFLDDIDVSCRGHKSILMYNEVTSKYEVADPDLDAGISNEDDSGDEIILNATTSGGADESGSIQQENNTRMAASSNTTVSTMTFSTPTITLTDSASATVTVDISSMGFSAMENLTVSRALVSDGSGDVSVSNVTSSEVNMLDGGTSATGTTLAGADRVITNDAGTMVQVALTDFDTYFDCSLSFPALSAANTFTATQSGSITALTDASTIAVNLALNNHFSVTLAGNRTLGNPSNIVAGTSGSIFITQDGTGSRTLSYGSYYDFAGGTAPTLTTTAAKIDRIDYIARTTTSLHCVFTGDLS